MSILVQHRRRREQVESEPGRRRLWLRAEVRTRRDETGSPLVAVRLL
jgi:hypothetical protein|tara:strand:+ start:89 stop:229 length:141 start_codon:yes stop_codon:yes gene_type:complete